jgi:hypothetical protein
MPFSEKMLNQICNTVSYVSSLEGIKKFKFGITRQGILKRFGPHKSKKHYEYIVSLADDLSCDDAVELEDDLHDWVVTEAKTSRWDKHVYKKFVHKNKKKNPYSHGPGKKGRHRNYSVYMVW